MRLIKNRSSGRVKSLTDALWVGAVADVPAPLATVLAVYVHDAPAAYVAGRVVVWLHTER